MLITIICTLRQACEFRSEQSGYPMTSTVDLEKSNLFIEKWVRVPSQRALKNRYGAPRVPLVTLGRYAKKNDRHYFTTSHLLQYSVFALDTT
jgi:hypothetical protein